MRHTTNGRHAMKKISCGMPLYKKCAENVHIIHDDGHRLNEDFFLYKIWQIVWR
jgi:hypothetical protein